MIDERKLLFYHKLLFRDNVYLDLLFAWLVYV